MDRAGDWRLSPAYDLVFSYGPGGEHTMAVGGEAARPGEPEMLRVGASGGIDDRRAREIVDEVREAVREWPRFAEAAGVPRVTMRRIADAIAAATTP
jgi:serine/threonine-protein kinase HipA